MYSGLGLRLEQHTDEKKKNKTNKEELHQKYRLVAVNISFVAAGGRLMGVRERDGGGVCFDLVS